MTYYYTVPTIGTGTETDPYRPDLDDGTSFAGQVGNDGAFLVIVDKLQSTKSGRTQQLPIQALQSAANAKGISFSDVQNWYIE